MNTKILICCHKESPLPQSDIYLPIQVGKAISDVDLGIQGDDTGDNISYKNASYCELTGMYWAWKNLKNVDVIGLCHYRRYFNFKRSSFLSNPSLDVSFHEIDSLDLSIPGSAIDEVYDGKTVVPNYLHLWQTLGQDYCCKHISDDYRVMTRIIYETQHVHIVKAYDNIMKSNRLMPYNMFLMSWANFSNYCEWLFPLLSRIELEIDISNYNNVQKRIFGYMAERLFNVWLRAEKLSLIHKPVMLFVDKPSPPKNNIMYHARNLVWDFSNRINVLARSLSNAPDFPK